MPYYIVPAKTVVERGEQTITADVPAGVSWVGNQLSGNRYLIFTHAILPNLGPGQSGGARTRVQDVDLPTVAEEHAQGAPRWQVRN